MDTQLLETFRTVAHLGSITAAARRLRFTQSAVSRQIAALESQIGATLFERQPRGVSLTHQGRVLLPYAEKIANHLADALRALGDEGAARLRVGAFPTAMAALVPRALATFRNAHAEVALSLVEGRTPELLDRLTAGDADVAVVSSSPATPVDTTRFTLHHLLDERLLVAVSQRHRLAGQDTVRLSELADDAFIVGSATAEDALLRAALPNGFQPRVDIVAADWTGKLGCVAADLGVALVPALAVRGTPADITLLRLHPGDETVRRIFAAVPAGRPVPRPVADFLGHLRAAAVRPAEAPASSCRG